MEVCPFIFAFGCLKHLKKKKDTSARRETSTLRPIHHRRIEMYTTFTGYKNCKQPRPQSVVMLYRRGGGTDMSGILRIIYVKRKKKQNKKKVSAFTIVSCFSVFSSQSHGSPRCASVGIEKKSPPALLPTTAVIIISLQPPAIEGRESRSNKKQKKTHIVKKTIEIHT